MKNIKLNLFIVLLFCVTSCESYLDIRPDDKITDSTFWENVDDAQMALNGIYNILQSTSVFGYGGGLDACTPNAFQWAWWEGQHMQIGNGSIMASSNGMVLRRWSSCYRGIGRANTLLLNIEKINSIPEQERNRITGETYFLRAVFYDLLVRTYGDVPLILTTIMPEEAQTIHRTESSKVWEQVYVDYDKAIALLPKEGKKGQATKGAALGMKMKALLYNAQWNSVLDYCEQINKMDKYKLFASYHGLFQFENEGNDETLFAVSFMSGKFNQGSYFDRGFQPQNLKYGIDGSNSVAPTQILVDSYETIDGKPINAENPYENRDPRLDFTILRPGAYFQGQLYPKEIKNHTGCKLAFGFRKYLIETMKVEPYESPLDFMVLRYADVLLCQAEALIETNKDISKAMEIINRIRTERTDVKLFKKSVNLSQDEARKALRQERCVELALEGQYWDDIKRWGIGPDIYPCKILGANGELLDEKFPNGYNLKRDNLLPIPDKERALNKSLTQNSGY